MRWYQLTKRELWIIGVVQVASAVFAALGTAALGMYMDLQKDIAFAQANGDKVPDFAGDIMSLLGYGWLSLYGLAVLAFVLQFTTIRGIQIEHGDLSLWQRVKGLWHGRT